MCIFFNKSSFKVIEFGLGVSYKVPFVSIKYIKSLNSKKTCFTIFVITTIVIITAFILKISTITTHIESIFHAMKHPYLAVSALIIAFLLIKYF